MSHRDDILRQLQQERAAQARQRAEQKKRAQQEEYADNVRRFADHKRNFFCHRCGAVSRGPASEVDMVGDGDIVRSQNYDEPTGLRRCDSCHRWTCDNCLVQEGPFQWHFLCLTCLEEGKRF